MGFQTLAPALRMIALCGLLLLGACSGKVELLSAVSESEGNDALAALLDAGLDARKQITKAGVSIQVRGNEVGRALDTLKAMGLPRERFDGMGEIFRKEGLVSSPLEERARYLYALSQELANTLTQVDGVLVARVHVVLSERGSIGETTTPSTAAVFIKHRRDYTLDALQPQIRRLVTHSIPSLNESQVTVILIPSHPIENATYADKQAAPRFNLLADMFDLSDTTSHWLLIILFLFAATGIVLSLWLILSRVRRLMQSGLPTKERL